MSNRNGFAFVTDELFIALFIIANLTAKKKWSSNKNLLWSGINSKPSFFTCWFFFLLFSGLLSFDISIDIHKILLLMCSNLHCCSFNLAEIYIFMASGKSDFLYIYSANFSCQPKKISTTMSTNEHLLSCYYFCIFSLCLCVCVFLNYINISLFTLICET